MLRHILALGVIFAFAPVFAGFGQTSPTLVVAEYFFDQDPGEGQGTLVGLTGADAELDLDISLGGLGLGPHRLGIRVADFSGSWSHVTWRTILVERGGSSPVASLHYRALGGTGDSVVQDVAVSSGATVEADFVVDLTALGEPGAYRLEAWAEDARGLPTHRYFHEFEVLPANNPPQAFGLTSPDDGAVVSTSTVGFAWEEASDGDGDAVTYALQLTGSAVDSTITGLTETSTEIDLAGLAVGTVVEWTVIATDGADTTAAASSRSFTYSPSSSAADPEEVPGEAVIGLPYPNPAAGTYFLGIDLPGPERVLVRVTDLLGRLVGTYNRGMVAAGQHRLHMDASHLAPGAYFIQVSVGASRAIKPVLVVR